MISSDEVKKLARLARLSLQSEEIQKFTKDIGSVIEHVEALKQISVDSIEPLTHVSDQTNIFREDKVANSLPADLALKNAPDTSGQFFRVPLIKEG